jgi:cytochrome P450
MTISIEELRRQHAIEIDVGALEADPFPILEKLRKEKPVSWVPQFDAWFVTRWHDVVFVNSHPEIFTAETNPSIAAKAVGCNMMTLEGEKTKRLKSAMQPPFTVRGPAGDYIREKIDKIANGLIDGFADLGEVEIMSEYAQPLATQSLQIVLGLDNVSHQELWNLCQDMIKAFGNFDDDPNITSISEMAKSRLWELIKTKIDEKKQSSDHTAISCLANLPRVNLTDEEIISNIRLMIAGGINEPRDGIGIVVSDLCGPRSAMQAELMDNNNNWMPYVTELFRLHPPVAKADRQITQEVELGGITLPKGEIIASIYSSANRDEEHYAHSSEFDLQRQDKQHFSFGYGQHECLGRWLGTREVIAGARHLIKRLKNLRIHPDEKLEFYGFEFRGPRRLRMCWDV